MHYNPQITKPQANLSSSSRQTALTALRALLDRLTAAAAPITTRLITPKARLKMLDKLAYQIYERSGEEIYLLATAYLGRFRRMLMSHATCGSVKGQRY